MKKWILLLALSSTLFAELTPCGCTDTGALSPAVETQNICNGNTLSDAMEALKQGQFDMAVAIFKSLAEQGNYIAEENLGVMYNNGYGVAKNLETATYWFNKAEETRKANKSTKIENLCSNRIADNQKDQVRSICQNMTTACY